MASALLRRSAVTAALATVATIASPLVGMSSAATFAAVGITSTPSPDGSTTPQTVEAERPTITATFNADLAAGSTMTLVKKGDGTNLCSTFAISGPTVSCTPDVALPLGQTYDAVGHGVAGDGSHADSATFEFQPSYPSYKSSVPVPGGSLQVGDSNHTIKIVYNTRKGLDASKSFIRVRNFLDGAPGNPIAGTSTTSASGGLPNSVNDTMTFKPSTAMSSGAEYEVTAHVEETGESATNPATADTVFDMFIQPAAPSNLAVPVAVANNVNDKTFHLTGDAGPGQTVNVTVTGKDATTNQFTTTASGSVAVPTCGQVTCHWDVTVDVSALHDTPPNLTWTAQAVDGDGSATSAVSGPAFAKDTTAPTTPSSPAATFPSSPTVLHVTANNADGTPDVDHYVVTITDSASNTLGPKSVAPDGSDNLTTDINVSSLTDGTLTVTIAAVDGQGNQSGNATLKPFKDAGNTPDFANSTVTTNGVNETFPQVDGRAINSPTVVTVVFAQNINPDWTDSRSNPSQPVHHPSTLCVEDKSSFNGTNCLNGATTFPQPNVMQTTIGFQLAQTDGYHVFATAWPSFCKNLSLPTDTQDAHCTAFQSDIENPESGDPFTFTVDDTPPAAPSVAIASPIDATTIGHVAVSGTTEPGSTVTVTARSSGGGSLLFANPGGTRADSGGHYSFVSNFTSLPDGTLTIAATAKDAAGNTSPAGAPSTAPVLQARPTAPQNFGAAAGDHQVVLGWAAPASNGGHPLTSYSLTVTDLTAKTAPQTTTLPGDATSTTVGSLANGHSYSFSLLANNDIGAGKSAAATATPRGATALSAIAPGTITYGTFISLHGTLTNRGAAVPSKPVTVTTTYYNGTHGATYHVTTDSAGNWVIAGLAPAKNVTYVATFAGDAAYSGASAVKRVYVRAVLKITKVSAANSSHLTAVTLRGTLRPGQVGRHVYIYEVLASGRTKLIGHTTVNSKSAWTFSHKWARGKHTVIARFFSQNGNLGKWSNRVRFSRT